MTEDVDLVSTSAAELAESIRGRLAERFHIAMRVREVAEGKAFRIDQVRKPRNRHIADVRSVESLPPHRIIEGVRVMAPGPLAAMKAIAVNARSGREKGLSDRLDRSRLLRAIPELREDARIAELAAAHGVGAAALAEWRALAASPLEADDDDDV